MQKACLHLQGVSYQEIIIFCSSHRCFVFSYLFLPSPDSLTTLSALLRGSVFKIFNSPAPETRRDGRIGWLLRNSNQALQLQVHSIASACFSCAHPTETVHFQIAYRGQTHQRSNREVCGVEGRNIPMMWRSSYITPYPSSHEWRIVDNLRRYTLAHEDFFTFTPILMNSAQDSHYNYSECVTCSQR